MTELRDLKASDVFPMVSILRKIGLGSLREHLTADKLKGIMSGDADETVIGYSVLMELVTVVVDHLPECDNEIYKFLSGLSGLTVDQVADLPLGEFMEMIIAVFQKKEFGDFYQAVSKFLS